jgi:predicted small secreted protein
MKRWFVLIFLLGFFSVGITFIGYFSFALSRNVDRKEIVRKTALCREIAEKVERDLHKPYSPLSLSAVPYRYHYNSKLDRCFYLGGESQGQGDDAIKYLKIIDAFDGKLLHVYTERAKPVPGSRYDAKYKRIREELFEEKPHS